MESIKECPESTAVYISGDELKAAWRFKEKMQYSSLSWAVRILVREGWKAQEKEAV